MSSSCHHGLPRQTRTESHCSRRLGIPDESENDEPALEPGRVVPSSGCPSTRRAAFIEPLDPAAQCVWRSMPPVRAACSRSMPLRTAAKDRSRRLWLACLDPAASRRRSKAE